MIEQADECVCVSTLLRCGVANLKMRLSKTRSPSERSEQRKVEIKQKSRIKKKKKKEKKKRCSIVSLDRSFPLVRAT